MARSTRMKREPLKSSAAPGCVTDDDDNSTTCRTVAATNATHSPSGSSRSAETNTPSTDSKAPVNDDGSFRSAANTCTWLGSASFRRPTGGACFASRDGLLAHVLDAAYAQVPLVDVGDAISRSASSSRESSAPLPDGAARVVRAVPAAPRRPDLAHRNASRAARRGGSAWPHGSSSDAGSGVAQSASCSGVAKEAVEVLIDRG